MFPRGHLSEFSPSITLLNLLYCASSHMESGGEITLGRGSVLVGTGRKKHEEGWAWEGVVGGLGVVHWGTED
jgi:hypothetical protein